MMNTSGTALGASKPTSQSPHCLYPEDIMSFTRKKLFLIVESNNSISFKVNNLVWRVIAKLHH